LLRLRFYVLPSLARLHQGAQTGGTLSGSPAAALIRSPLS